MRLAACLLLLAACHPTGTAKRPLGAPCEGDDDCGSGRFFCATDHPRGYCVAECRSDNECGGGVCVRADPATVGQCHAGCARDTDCRALEGYICKLTSPDASHAYCDPLSSRHVLRRLRSTWWR